MGIVEDRLKMTSYFKEMDTYLNNIVNNSHHALAETDWSEDSKEKFKDSHRLIKRLEIIIQNVKIIDEITGLMKHDLVKHELFKH